MGKIKLLAMDVDGTMTDGHIYMSENGELFKVFDVKDGMGIKIAHENGIRTAIITGRDSKITQARARELRIEDLYQGVSDKASVIRELGDRYGLNAEEIAYIGDDINDIPVFRLVGTSFAPADSVKEVRDACTVLLKSNGGDGAVRECVEYIVHDNANKE